MKNRLRILTLATLICLLFSLLPGAAFAEDELTVVTVLSPTSGTIANHYLTNAEEYAAWGPFAEGLAKLGVKLEFEAVVDEQYEVVLQTRLASGGNLPDIISLREYVNPSNIITYGENGMFADLIELFNTYDEDGSILDYWNTYSPEYLGFVSTEKGKCY